MCLVGQDVREWVFMAPTLTLIDGIVHFGRLDQQVGLFYGSDGFRIVNSLVCALESPANIYRDIDHQISSSEGLVCMYYTTSSEFLKTLRNTLSWVCLLNRKEIRQSISLSKGRWHEDTFLLDPVQDVDWSRSCWSQTLRLAMVASFDERIPRSPMMLTCFSLVHQLAGVHAAIYVDEGIIFHGGMTALTPVERRGDKIVWNFEGKLDDLLPVSEVKAVKSKWHQTLHLNELQSAPVLLGWSEGGSLLLGTEQASRDVAWPSEAKNAHLMKLSKPTFQASFKIPAHLSVAASATLAPVHFDIIHSLPENNARKLLLCTKKPWIVYDDVQRRAWLVPQISLIHHMLVLSQAQLTLTLPPFAPPSPTGEESLRTLLENAEYVLYQYGQQKLLLSELVVEFIECLCGVAPIPTLAHGEIVGYDLMELLSGVRKQTPKMINPNPRPYWMRLLSQVPCLIASNAGELMVSERSPTPGFPCNTLAGKNYLAATVNMLTEISHNTTANAWKVAQWTLVCQKLARL